MKKLYLVNVSNGKLETFTIIEEYDHSYYISNDETNREFAISKKSYSNTELEAWQAYHKYLFNQESMLLQKLEDVQDEIDSVQAKSNQVLLTIHTMENKNNV